MKSDSMIKSSVRRMVYKALSLFSLKCCEIRARTIRKMLWIGETGRAYRVLHHTLYDLSYAKRADYSEENQSKLVELFSELAISLLSKDFTSADYDLRDIEFYLHQGETETKERLLDDGDELRDLGLLSLLPMDLRREIGSQLE